MLGDLGNRPYTGNTMASNSSEEEQLWFREVKGKLKSLAKLFKKKYDPDWGPFESAVSSGNPIAVGGTKLNVLWSGIFKGSENKQYAAQISFVINKELKCLDVGFYFGRASARSLSAEKRESLMSGMLDIASLLSSEIQMDGVLSRQYEKIFDLGFKAFVNHARVTSQDWLKQIQSTPQSSQIVINVFPNEDGIIEFKTIDCYVALLVHMMGPIPSKVAVSSKVVRKYKPLTAEQRARQAERRTLIGFMGEKFVMEKESARLESLGLKSEKYPDHVAMESMDYGYDILSLDENGNKIYIEVKTTTRTKDDIGAWSFHISANEYEWHKDNAAAFRLYRVFDVEGNHPEIDILDMDSLEFKIESYKAFPARGDQNLLSS